MLAIIYVFLMLMSAALCNPYNSTDSNTSSADTETLVLSQCIFRHGNRTRDTTEGFKDDLHGNESDWLPLGLGQLTAIGRNTEYQLGLFLRRRYTGFLPRAYFYKDITVLASRIYRTMESAQLVCAGLYSPPTDFNRWGESNDLSHWWQPVPVKSFGDDDLLVYNQVSCPPYDKDYEDVLQRQMSGENDQNKELYNLLAKNTGVNVTSVREVAKIYNTLKVDAENNKSLPEWATPQLISKLAPFRLPGFQVRTHTDLMKTIKTGPLFHRLQEILNNKTRQELSPDNKMILYSAHDTTLVGVLNSLGATNMVAPEYGACLMIELHKINGEYFVQLFYLRSGLDHTVERVLLQDWKNDTPIPLKVFNGLLDKYKISTSDWYKKCGKDQCAKS